jgi:hypothetical protein
LREAVSVSLLIYPPFQLSLLTGWRGRIPLRRLRVINLDQQRQPMHPTKGRLRGAGPNNKPAPSHVNKHRECVRTLHRGEPIRSTLVPSHLPAGSVRTWSCPVTRVACLARHLHPFRNSDEILMFAKVRHLAKMSRLEFLHHDFGRGKALDHIRTRWSRCGSCTHHATNSPNLHTG